MSNNGPISYYFSVKTMMCNDSCPKFMQTIFNPEHQPWVDFIETECLYGPGSGWLRVHVNNEHITAQQIIDFLKEKSKNHHIAVEERDPEKRIRARFGK